MESDPQPNEEVTSANTEINSLTDTLENPAPLEAPTQDVQTFWSRLDTLVTHLEESNQHKSRDKLRSFTNQPERVCISSDNDINTAQTQDAIAEQTFSSFRVAIARPFLDVKSIQLLRASIPNAVTNIPDEECVFWYYRIPTKTFSGTISISIPGVAGYSNASFTTDGIITPALSTSGITLALPSQPSVGFVTYAITGITGLAVGTELTISGISPAGYSGTFYVSQVNPPNAFTVANATTATATYSSAKWSLSITDYIDWGTVPYSVCNVAGVPYGYFAPPTTNPGTVSIYSSITLQGATIGTITRSSDLFMPAPSFLYLHMVRLLPSFYKAELFDIASGQNTDLPPTSTYGFNRTFSDYQDLASELAKSCAADPAYDAQIDAGFAFPLFIPNDISLTFNQTLNKFIFTGNNTIRTVVATDIQFATYLSAGYNDVNLWNTALMNTNSPSRFNGEPTSAPQLFAFTAGSANSDFNFIRGASGQPWQIYRTLNLRLGFTWNGSIAQIASAFPINITNLTLTTINASVIASYYNRLRPVPEYVDLGGALRSETTPYDVTFYTADGYANLVNTNTVSLYADFTGGSTYDSMANTQLLACVPMNASNLGVTFYNTTIYCPLTKISDQIYEIEIRMLTDTGVPYVIPNSAIVSLELALTY